MSRWTKRRFTRLYAAIAAALAGVAAMFWRSGTCTDFVMGKESECTIGPLMPTVIAAVLLWGVAAWLLYTWWNDNRRA